MTRYTVPQSWVPQPRHTAHSLTHLQALLEPETLLDPPLQLRVLLALVLSRGAARVAARPDGGEV
eukprot:scaffold31278_cov74-Phaeocystis_antarctica.AAC.15